MDAARLWDLYLEAVNARDAQIDRTKADAEREWRGIIEMRLAAFRAQVEREKAAPRTLVLPCEG